MYKRIISIVFLSTLISALVSAWITYSEWKLNPGDIYRPGGGTQWPIVWETFFSWFLPLFPACTAIFLLIAYIIKKLKT